VNFFERLRHLLPHRNGHSNGHGRGREILIGINHEYITMIDPKEHKLLEVKFKKETNLENTHF
jgi:hypothetical protein